MRLMRECANLKQQLTDARLEIASMKVTCNVQKAESEMALEDYKTESAEAIKAAVAAAVADQKVVFDGLKVDIDDLEQYGRRKSICVQNVALVPGESKDKTQDLLLASVNARLEPAGIKLDHKQIICFHRSSAEKDDKNIHGGKVSQVIIKLKTGAFEPNSKVSTRECALKKTLARPVAGCTMISPSAGSPS
jgi:hypothetical protein